MSGAYALTIRNWGNCSCDVMYRSRRSRCAHHHNCYGEEQHGFCDDVPLTKWANSRDSLPQPPGIAAASGGTSIFTVDSNISTIAAIHFYFENGSRGCRFDTSYTTGGGYTKMAASSGGTFVTCTAGTINFNATTHDYSITFTLN